MRNIAKLILSIILLPVLLLLLIIEKIIKLFVKTTSTKTGDGHPGISTPAIFQADIQQAQAAEERYLQGGGIQALNEAVAAWERILSHPEFAEADEMLRLELLNDSAVTYMRRYQASGGLKDLDSALSCWQTLAKELAEDSPYLPAILNNIGIALRDRHNRTGEMKDLENAISNYEKAVRITPENAPDLPGYLNNLGNGLRNRYARTGEMKDLENAISNYEKAAKKALDVHAQAGITSARTWLRWAFDRESWQEVETAYGYVCQASDRVLQANLLRGEKEIWLKEVQGLPAHAAYALAKQDRLQDAVVSLERGLARLLSDALAIDRADLLELENTDHAHLIKDYQESVAEWKFLTQQSGKEGLTPEESNQFYIELKTIRQKLDATIASIREIKGYENFLSPPDADEIAEAVQQHPMIYVMATKAGGLALIVYQEETIRVWLPELTEAKLTEVTQGLEKTYGGYLGAYFQWRGSDDPAVRDAWFDQLEKTTGWLWDAVMSPIIEMLKTCGVSKTPQVSRVTLIPVGRLNLLPLHAAWTPDETAPTGRHYALDDLIISYAPNARALVKTLRVLETIRVSSSDETLLAIEEPKPTNANALPFTKYEVESILSTFPESQQQIIRNEAATREAVRDALKKYAYTVLHFSCHGMTNFNEPLSGGLVMSNNEFLTLKDLLDLKMHGARLATLSACETGIPGMNLPDEIVNLPSGLLQAGIAGVAASLWSVSDLSTMMLMAYFYDLWREKHMEPVEALRQAQIWMRDTTNAEKTAYFKKEFDPDAGSTRMARNIAKKLIVKVRFRNPEQQDFQRPFHWAAFGFFGM